MTIDTEFLDQLGRFSLIIRKRITSSYAGGRRSTATGRGLTIQDYRPYVKGDDTRLIDWKVFARTDEFFVKQFEEEKTLTAHIILDRSKSMDFGKPFTKFEYGSMLGLGFAYLAMKDNDKFEFSTFSEDLNPFKPKKGMSQLASTVEILKRLHVRGDSKFEDCMQKYKKLLHSRALVVVISDFLYDLDEIKRGLLRLGTNELKVIQVLDREEVDLKIEGDVNLHDSETEKTVRTYISRRLREKYQHKLNEHAEGIHDICTKLNADFYQVVPDQPIFDSFYKVLKF